MNFPRRSSRKQRIGYTLVELVIVVMVLGILAGAAAPKLLDVHQESQISAIMRHINVGQDAVQRYYAEHGELPDDVTQGRMPPELVGYLAPTYFEVDAPGGGVYDWNGEGLWGGVYAGMSIIKSGGNPPTNLWREIDVRYDDGDLSSGKITMFSNRTLQFELVP